MSTVPTPTTACPACASTFVTALDAGGYFCAACRHEWDPNARPAPAPDVETDVDLPELRAIVDAAVDDGERHTTFVDVEHDDGGSGNWRTDRYSYVTIEPHTDSQAKATAITHYTGEVGSEIRAVRVVTVDDDPPALTVEQVDDEMAGELEQFIAATDAEAETYLASLVGTGVMLEGGQRATLLGFPDDDHAEVQLSDGSVAVVDFNELVSIVEAPTVDAIVDVEIDDATVELLGDAVLTMACLAIEAGLASLEGEPPDYELIEPPAGWIPDDADAIPLMEQACAVAVAMLIRAFGLPRDTIAAAVDKVRPATRGAATTEDTGHDADTDDNDNTGDPDEPGGVA